VEERETAAGGDWYERSEARVGAGAGCGRNELFSSRVHARPYNDLARVAAVREGVEKALSRHEIEIVGRVAVPLLEGWVLALRGERGTEALSPGAKARLREVGIGGAAEMAEEARAAVLADVPPDAESLLAWLADARRALEASETVE
jgi:hypothetical protein